MNPLIPSKEGAFTGLLNINLIRELLPEDSDDQTWFYIEATRDRLWINGKLVTDLNSEDSLVK